MRTTRRRGERVETRQISVGQGLFALRYAASTAPVAPQVAVVPEAGLSLVAAPGCDEGRLDGPGDCLVVRAERPSSLHVTVQAAGRDGSLDATLELERIVGTSARLVGASSQAEPTALEIMAHVARRGDVIVPMDKWVGGPQVPVRIEGITIDWPDRPADVELRYTALGRGRSRRRWQECRTGEFAGSRGEAAPLVGLEIALAGPGAGRYRLSGEALFLGSHVIAESGPVLRFAGPTGGEPLVGLRLSLAAERSEIGATHAGPLARAGHHLTGRVRAFRGAAMPAA